jgi:glycosyltransferase involved in cell wall biosynthesis
MIQQSSDNERINILLVNDHLGWAEGKIHGVARWFLNTVPAIDRSRFNIIPCILRKKEESTDNIFKKAGVKIRYLKRSKYDIFTLIDFLKIIKKEKIHLLHLQGFGSTGFGRLAGLITKTPVIIHVHSFYVTLPIEVKIADMVFNRRDSKAIAVSNSVREFCVNRRKMDRKKLEVLVYGIDVNKYSPASLSEISKMKKKLRIPVNHKIVGTVTRLYEQKGNKYFLMAIPEVLKKHPETTFVIIGDGPLLQELEAMAANMGINGNVIFAGFCEDVITAISMFDISVFPSLWEGTPLTMLETMSIGKPIVSTTADGLGEVLTDEVSALLVPPKEPMMLAEKITVLLDNPEKAKKLAKSAHAHCQKYSIERHARRLERIYDDVAKISSGKQCE